MSLVTTEPTVTLRRNTAMLFETPRKPSIGSTMTSDTPIHDWLRPRLADLVQQAERAGFLREAVVAVIMDLMTAPPYDDAPPPVE